MAVRFPLALAASVTAAALGVSAFGAGTPQDTQAGAHPGLRHLNERAYSPSFIDADIFAQLWRVWDAPSRAQAAAASEPERRRLTLKRYGLFEAEGGEGARAAPLGFAVKSDGSWAMTCLICHAGAVNGRAVLGAPNNRLDFAGLYEDVEKTVVLMHGEKDGPPPFPQGLMFLAHGVTNPMRVPFPDGLLSVSRGTFNSFTFSVAFFSFRDKELNVTERPRDLKPLNHYLDAPPLWNVAKKTRFYYDGFTEKALRPLMQFSLDPSFSGAAFRAWEDDYKDIYAWLHTLEAPKYDGPVDAALAAAGAQVYSDTCWTCHGTPGRDGAYRNKVVPIDKVGTDRARFDGLSAAFKAHLSASWLGDYGATDIVLRPEGYVAPPLDGIWASAPYLHNGSVPTLYHMLFPQERPAVWRVRDEESYDHTRMGLAVEEFDAMPPVDTAHARRSHIDTMRPTMSNKGHLFAEELTREQRMQLLEYLKTL
jgi:mono/diheme cytochrome c family protein